MNVERMTLNNFLENYLLVITTYLLSIVMMDRDFVGTTFKKKSNVVPSNKHPCKVNTHKLLNQACIYLKIQNIT